MSDPRFLTLNAPGAPSTQAEAEAIFAALAERLQADGASWEEIVWMRIFYRARADFPLMNEVRKPLLEEKIDDYRYPATTGVVTGSYEGGPALEFEVMLAPGKVLRDTPRVWKTIGEGHGRPPAAHGVEWGGLVWVSGQVGYDEDAELVDATALGQLPQAMRNLWAIVEDAGARRGDVVQFTFHLVGSAFGEYEAVRERFEQMLAETFGDAPPVVHFIGVDELFMPGVLVEIEAFVATDPATRQLGAPAGPADDGELGALPASAPAGRAGEVVFASGAALGASPRECLETAVAQLEAALASVDSSLPDLRRATLWFSPVGARAELEALAKELLTTSSEAPAPALLLVPIAVADRVEASVRLEAMAISPT